MSENNACDSFGLVVGIAGLLSFGGWTVFPSHPIFGVSTPGPLITLPAAPDAPPQAMGVTPAPPAPSAPTAPEASAPQPDTRAVTPVSDGACISRADSGWQGEANPELGTVISRCAGGRYFAFQCSGGNVALVTDSGTVLRRTRFFQHGRHLEGYDLVFSPTKLGSYIFHPLIDDPSTHQFSVFRNAKIARLETADGSVDLDLTGLHMQARKNFSSMCEGTDPV